MMSKKRKNKQNTKIRLFLGLSLVWGLFFSVVGANVVSAQNESLNPNNTENKADAEATATQSALLENLERMAAGDSENANNEDIKAIYQQMESKKTGFIGQVLSIKDKTIKINDPLDSEKFLTFDKSTVLVSGKSQTNADSADLAKWIEIDDWIVAIGVIEDGTFMPRRILISATDLTPKEKIVKRGVLKSLSSKELVFTPAGNENEETMTVGRNSEYQDSSGETIKSKEFTEGAEILVTGVSSGGKSTVNTLRLL